MMLKKIKNLFRSLSREDSKKQTKKVVNHYKSTISKEEINELPLNQFNGEVVVVDSMHGIDAVINYLKDQPLLGIDTETRPSFKKNSKNIVALLQLSTDSKAFLFRLNKIGLPKNLIPVLSNSEIIKVGAALKDDIRALVGLSDFEPAGFVDLQQYSNDFGIEANALKSLTAIVLGFRISKSQQTSNWENNVLTKGQIYYAATDAWVCYEIYNKLVNG